MKRRDKWEGLLYGVIYKHQFFDKDFYMEPLLYCSGENLYKKFYGFPGDKVIICRTSRLVPPVVVELGELRGLIYRSDKWSPGRYRTFIHFMEDPPKLVCNTLGNQLYIIGGSYRITPKGIEG